MKCQNCEGEATIHFKEVVDGVLREIHLCESCAGEKGFHLVIEQNKLSIANQFIWMAENLYPESAAKVGQVQCPECGLRYSHFARSGRLGCSACYDAFAVQMRQILRRVHGSIQHTGKGPGSSEAAVQHRRSLARLREELNRAIEREEFEGAAALRDQIRELEGKAAREETQGKEESA
jgi:protein arginine kinase activator